MSKHVWLGKTISKKEQSSIIDRDAMVKAWLNSSIKNPCLNGYTEDELKWIDDKYVDRGIQYLNSNKYQVDKLCDSLINFSSDFDQTYKEYEYNLEENTEDLKNNYNPLFNEEMKKHFIKFCYKNRA